MTDPIPEAPMADRVVELVRELRECIDALERVVAEYKAGRPIDPIPTYFACERCGGNGVIDVESPSTLSGSSAIQYITETCPECFGEGHA